MKSKQAVQKDRAPYMVIRRNQIQPGQMDGAVQTAEGELWSVASNGAGFVEYYLLPMGDGGCSVRLFETQAAAEEPTRRTMDFVQQHPNAASLLQGPYEIVAQGKGRLHKVKQA